MASGGAEEDDEGISLDIDDVHMLLHVEQEEIQKRTFTNWINAQLAKRCPPSHVSDLFSDLRDGSVLLDLLEVITGLPMKRQRGHGFFQQRANIETALDFLRNKSIKLVNINIPDIIDGKPSIVLGLIWAIILHCHIEEMANSLSSSFPHSSLDSLESLESISSTPTSASPVPLDQKFRHQSFGLSAKKVLLTWAREQCQRVGCPVSIKNFKSSWRSGEAFLAILSSFRPQLVDLTRARSRSHLENLEEAFELTERELHIPRLLEPQDVDVTDPDEKSIMTFVAQFLQFYIDVSSPDVHLQEPVVVSSVLKNCNRPSQSLLPSDQNTFKTEIEKHQTSQPSLVKVSSEGPAEARKAKSRLEKARVRLQSRIQQATKLFSNREISQAEAKRKQKALKMLHPAVLDDFLSAVEDFGSFCSESQVQDLLLLSDSLSKQWEEVRMEMAAYIPMLWSRIKDKKCLSVMPCVIYTNTHKASDQTDHGTWQQQQKHGSMWTEQEREWTAMSETTNPQHKIDPISQEVLQSVKCFTDVMDSVDDDIILISESINKIISKPINISSLTLTDLTAPSELKDINNRLQAKIDQLLDQKKHENNSSYSSVHHIRQYLEQVLSAIQALDLFLAILRKVKTESSKILKQEHRELQWFADWEFEIQQRFQFTFEQSESTDSALKDVGLRLTMDGANVSCCNIVTQLFKHIEEELKDAKNVDEVNVAVEEQMKVCEKTSGMEDDLRTKCLKGINNVEMLEYEQNRQQLVQGFNREALETRDHTSRRRTGQVKDEGKSLDQKRLYLEEKLKDLRTTAEDLGLQEPTLPALQQRSQALMKLKNSLSGLQSVMEHIQNASQSESCDVSVNTDIEDLWDVTRKAVLERLEQCNLLTEFLKKYQKISAEVSETLQIAENTIRDKVSYMGRENLQRLKIKITETKIELNKLADRIEELRSVSRQLHTHLLQIPQCTSVPFEPEADSLMDQWLDMSERVESHVENLHFALSLWEGALKLGAEVESWAINKLEAFAHSPTFQKEEDIKALQDEVEAHEESMQCLHRITIEIQSLLQSADPPLELQVLEPQMRKKIDELKEIVSEAEDVYRQTEAAKRNVIDRMTECFSSLHNIHQSLISLRGTDPAAVLVKLKDVCLKLHVQDEQVQGLLEDLQVLSSVGHPDSLQSLCDDGQKLQDKVRAVHELFSEAEGQTQRNIQVYDRLQKEHEHLKQWLNNVDYQDNRVLSVLQQDVFQHRVRTEALSQHVLLLRNSAFQQMPLIEESGKLLERYIKLEAVVLGGPREKQNRKLELYESLSPRSYVKEVKQLDAPVSENCGVQRGLHVASSATNIQTCATGNIVDDLKHEVQETKTGDLLRDLQTGMDCPSSASTSNFPSLNDNSREVSQPTQDCILEDFPWFELETCLSSLKAQLDGVCCPREAVCNEEQFGQLLQDCRHKLTSLQGKISTRQNQRENTDTTPTSYLEQKSLLQQLADMEKDLSRFVAQMEPGTCVSQQLNNLLNHKRALDNCMREKMVQAKKQEIQQVETETLYTVSESPWPISEPNGPDCTRPTVFSETGVTQVNIHLQQQRQTEQTQPPSSSQLSPVLDDTISDYKISNISCKSSLSTLPQKQTTALVQSCFSSASYCQPLHCNQSNIEIERKNLFNTEEKHPVCIETVTETSGGTNVSGLGQNQDAQTSVIQQATLDTYSADIQKTNTIVQDSESDMIGTGPSCSQCGASEVLPPTNGHKERHLNSCMEELQSKHNRETNELRNSQVNCGIDVVCNATAQDYKQKDMTPILGPILHTTDGEGLSKKLTMASDSESEDINAHSVEIANNGNEDQENNIDSSEKQYLDRITRLLQEVCKLEFPVVSEDTEVTQGQITVDMDTDGTGGRHDRYEGEGVPSGVYKHKFTMRDILSGVQGLVESSSFINMAPQCDPNGCLKSSPSEAEIYLMRTVQKVLACRYQPAQLSITAMSRQLHDAENYSCCVQEQVAAIKGTGESLTRLCDVALLDGSTTVQVKAAQLDQVKQYHRQLKIIKAFLEVVTTEQEKMSLHSLESHEHVAQLHALLRTMDQKTCLIDELVKSSGQLSVHLSNTDSLALVAHLRDFQEEWRLLEENIKRALHHASNSASQLSVFRQEANGLKDRLQNLLTSLSLLTVVSDFQRTMDLIFWTADLKLYNQLYIYLQSQFDALVQFSMGQKEKDDMESCLEELGSLLNVTKMKLGMLNKSYGGNSSSKIDKHLQGLIIWAKQAENYYTTGKNMALFPEEARIQIAEIEKFQKDVICKHSSIEHFQEIDNLDKREHEQVVYAINELYETISSNLCQSVETMKNNLKENEQLLDQFASMDIWLAEIHSKIDSKVDDVDIVSDVDITSLEKELITYKVAAMEIENQLKLVEKLEESCKKISAGLSSGESHYLVNRLSGISMELEGLLAHMKTNIWELEELINQWTTSDEELSSIETSLEQISIALKKLRFPLTIGSISDIGLLKHMLTEHECQVKEIRYSQETKRSLLLDTIGELLDKCNALTICANEQDKYLQLKRQMEESRDMINKEMSSANNKSVSLGDRFRLCQKILVELPLVKTQCQEAADQLEAIAQELYPSELNTERQRIHHIVNTLVSWEQSITEDIKNLESKLLLGLRFETELHALMELMQKTKQELEELGQVDPKEKAIDVRLEMYWIMWRNMESGMRMLEGLARKEKKNLRNYKELYEMRNAAMKECHAKMESLSQARESLKDFQWAAQGAISFLHNAEVTFLSSTGKFVDCTEKQKLIHLALETLEDGFQAHVDHLGKLMPHQPCLSLTKTEELHIQIFSQLLVERAVLEAQAQLRLEALQRCSDRQQKQRSCHEDVLQHLSGFEENLAICAAEHINSYEICVTQQKRAKLLQGDLQSLAEEIERLRAGCPMQGCGAGMVNEVGALWSRWASLRRGVGLLLAHTEQRAEEWKDISSSINQCCSSLQTSLPDYSSGGGVSEGEPEDLLAQTELHRTRLEQELRALASLEHRLQHALSLSHSQGPINPGPVGKTLVEIRESVRSLKERNQLVVEAAQAKEKEKQQVIEELTELEHHVLGLFPMLQSCSSQSQQLEYKNELSTLKAKMQHIVDSVHSRYSEIPADICKNLQEVQLSLQRAEEQITERSEHVQRLASRVEELRSGLEKVKELLRQRSSNVTEAQNALKLVWDELDLWHGRLMLLESEVQDLAQDVPDQAHLLMDQLTEPLQCYQNTAQMVEHHTAFLSKIPSCLHKFEDIMYRATCWLDEAESWLGASSSFTTARSLQNHATSLQLLLEDSERIRHVLQEFRPILSDISVVCDVSVQQKKLEDTDRHVFTMQQTILQPLGCFLQAATVVEDFEAELKTVERDLSKIEAKLSSEDNGNISVTEHLHNRQVILANAASIKVVLKEIQRVKEELNLPWAAEEQLLVFSKASSLLQHIEELEQLSHKQASALENNIRKMEALPTSKKPSDRKQESSSEEDEDEEDGCCHSSSSDTLTNSIPEDPDETIQAGDLQRMDEAEQLANVKVMGGLPNEFDTSLDTTESWLLSVRPWLDTSTSENMESDSETVDHGLDLEADAEDSLNPIHMTEEFQTPADNPSVDRSTCVALDNHGSQRHEDFVISTSQSLLNETTAGFKDTRLIPVRPITPFAATVIFEEDEECQSLSSSPIQELDNLNQSKEHDDSEMDENDKLLNCPKEPVRLNCQDNQPLWSQLSEQIAQKLSNLDKLQQDYQVIKEDALKTGSTCAVLQQTQQTILMLRPIVSSGVSGEGRDLFDTLKQVLLCLDALSDLVLTSVRAEDGDSELKLLQKECVTGQLTSLTELLDQIETVDNPDASQCVTGLQQCLFTFNDKLRLQMGLAQKMITNSLSFMDDLDLKGNEMFQSLEKAPKLNCVLVGLLRERPGERAELQQASQSLLQGMSRLVELGEECTTEGPTLRVHSHSELQDALQRPEKLLRVLASQLAFAQYLFQHQPGALKCPEEDWVQLKVRAKALLQLALDQQVTSQRRLQEWTLWEDNCGQLGSLLDKCEAFLSSQQPRGSEDGVLLQHRIDGCQQNLATLEKSRATLGLLLDQGENLHPVSFRQTGGALELQWRSIYRQTEQEMKRCRDMQENWASFQTDSASLRQWLIGAKKQVQTWTELAASSDLEQECVYSSLIKLLGLCVEVGSMSVQKVSVSRNVSQVLCLSEADCPGLRGQLTSLEEQFNQLITDLTKTQELLQQHLLKNWPPDDFLIALENWLQEIETQLNTEKEVITKADNSCLHHFKGLKTGLIQGQLLLDFLCQSGPQLVGEDAITLPSKRTMLAEKLGDLSLRWEDLQGELENQINGAEHMNRVGVQRQRKLQHLQNLIERQRKKLVQWKWPYSEYLAQKALLEWEGHAETLKDIAAAVEELRDTHLNAEKERGHTVHFSGQTEMLSHACEDLVQQMETLKPALHQTLDKWKCFKTYMNEISLYITRLRSSVLLHGAPIFSIQQAKMHLHNLQVLQSNAKEDEKEFWDRLDKSFQGLGKSIDPAAAHALNGQIERERERWKETLHSLKNELLETQKTVSMWQEFTNLYERCSLQLQQVLNQGENLCQILQHHQDQQAQLHSLEELQDTIESVKRELEDIDAASKPLLGRLNPTSCNIVQSQTSVLSRDVLTLSMTLEGRKKSIKESMEQQNELHVCLETFEKQTKDFHEKIIISMKHMDSAEQVFRELSYLFSSLIDVREMSAHVTLSNQEAQRLHILRKQYMENINQSFELYLQMHLKRQLSMDFEQKCKALKGIQKTLEQESSPRNPLNYNNLKQMSAVHQKLQGDIVIGHKLLHGLLCDAVKGIENASKDKRLETIAQVSSIKQRWSDVLNMVDQRRSLVKQQLSQYTIYQSGLKHLCNLLRDIDLLLLPPGPVKCISQIITEDYECFEETLQAHSAIYTRTVETGRSLCQSFTDSECQKQLQTEIQVLEQAWENATSLLGKQNTMVNTTVQKWSHCQARIVEMRFELDECGRQLKEMGPAKPVDSNTETSIQETELSLQRLTGGLKEVDTMKMDLSQYVMMAGGSELLEQQLEQLHIQWEELCMKVSLRRQEIADRLNAWTIFNDKNKEFCDWLTQMENKVCHSAELSFEEMVEKLKKDCMEEINLFSENKSHLKQLGEQLLSASNEAKQSQVHGSLQEVNQRWHNLFHHIENRVKKLKETMATVQQLDKNMNNLRSWLCRIEAELSRPITYSVLHHHEIQKRLAEHQELQRDIEQHTEGVASVLNLCDVLIRDEDAAGGTEADSDSLQETSRSLDQRWRTICAMALDRRLRIEETWRLWCKFLDDYSRFEDWLKMAERTAANPNTSDVLYTEAREELKKFEGFQRQVHERLTQLEIVNNQYRRLAQENRTDRSSQLKAMVHEGNRRWDTLHRRVATIIRRLKYFTSQREDFENTRESMLVWLTELDLQLTNVEHFSESDVHQKIQQLNSFQKEITLNTERIDGLIVFGEGLIQKSSPQDAALIEEELEELHSYCQEVFGRLVRFHQRLSQPPMPEVSTSFSLESSLELISRSWLGRSQGSFPATPTHLLTSPLSRSGRETPVSVDSLPLEWDHTGDVGGSSSHEDDEEDDLDDEGAYFSAVSSRSVCDSPRWQTQDDPELVDLENVPCEAPPTLASTPLKQGNYLHLMSQCSGSIEDFKRVSLILDDDESPDEFGLTGLNASGRQSGVIERWELLQAQSHTDLQDTSEGQVSCDLDNIRSWLDTVIPELDRVQLSDPPTSVEDMTTRAKELKEMHKVFSHHKSTMLSLNLRSQTDPDLQMRMAEVNHLWSQACTSLQHWDTTLRKTLMRCQEFHESLHSLLLWLAHAESRRYAVDINHPETSVKALKQHCNTLTDLREELLHRQTQQASLHALWTQLQPEHSEDSDEAQEKLHVTASKMKILLREVTGDLRTIQQHLENEPKSDEQDQRVPSEEMMRSKKSLRERRDTGQSQSFFYRLLRAAFPLHVLLLLLLLLPCLIPISHSEHSCTGANNFARSFYPMLHYTNGPPPT